MADEAHGGHDIRMQQEMWVSFCKIVKWSVVSAVVLLLFMAVTLV